MRKLSQAAFFWMGIGFIILFTGVIITMIIFSDGIEPGDGQLQIIEFTEKIQVEILSKNYSKETEFLMRAKIDGEQIGIIYFDENGDIQFDGDRERFEYALCKVFKIKGWRKNKK